MRNAVVYVATLLAFLAIDATWLTFVAGDVFKSEVGALLREAPRADAAIAFYALYVAGLVSLAITPALAVRSIGQAVSKGAIFGLCAYATFDLTNLAIIKDWTLTVSLFDMAWGAISSALASAIGYRTALFARGNP